MSANLKPGDEVVVRPGTYNEAVNITKDGSAAGYITLRSEVPGEAVIRPPSGAWNAISFNANYVVVDGFDIGGASGDGIEANNVHHIKILNNIVHDSGESGIQFNWSEFITIEGNETYNNASSGWFSGISIYQNRNITGDTTTTAAFAPSSATTSLTTTSRRAASIPTATALSSTISRARRLAAIRTTLFRRWSRTTSSTTTAARASRSPGATMSRCATTPPSTTTRTR